FQQRRDLRQIDRLPELPSVTGPSANERMQKKVEGGARRLLDASGVIGVERYDGGSDAHRDVLGGQNPHSTADRCGTVQGDEVPDATDQLGRGLRLRITALWSYEQCHPAALRAAIGSGNR